MDIKNSDELLLYMQKEINVEGRSLICALTRIADTISNLVEAPVSPMLADNEKRFLRLLIRDKKEEYGDELKTDIDLIRAVKQESIVKMDLLLEKLQ